MKKQLLALLVLVGLCCTTTVFSQSKNIHIKLKDTTALAAVRAIDTSLVVERIFPYSPKFEQSHKKVGLHLWYKVQMNDSLRASELLERFLKMDGIEKAEFDNKTKAQEKYEVIPVSETDLRKGEDLPMNDPLYPKQWDLTNHKFSHAMDINMEKAWQLETGSSDVIVAVMDQLFDPSHEDLKENVWVNEAELNGKPDVDDDGNGYVDDVYGYIAQYDRDYMLGDHGTHVAGTIAAVNNNGIGVCGIAGGDGSKPGVKVMRCHIFPSTSDEEKAKAYVYAADNGAVISQNSWVDVEAGYASVILDGIRYFMENAGQSANSPMKGGLVVWGAGNFNQSKKLSPDISPELNRNNLITVASVSPDGDKASYSNYGECIDIAAPGGEFNKQGTISTILKNRYGYMQGTSMACPHISGIAALVVSKFKSQNLTPKEVKRRILSSVKEVNRYQEGQVGYGLMGSGIADAWKALLNDQQKAPEEVSDLWISRNTTQLIELSWRIPEDQDDHSVDSCIVYWDTNSLNENKETIHHAVLYTGGYAEGDTVRYRLIAPQADCTYSFKVQCKDRNALLSGFSKEISCKPTLDLPVIYGKYLYNRFFAYQQNEKYDMQQDSLYLNYTILAPASMKVNYKLEDSGKAIQVLSFKDNKLDLLLAPTDQEPKVYTARIIAYDQMDEHVADTLDIAYSVRSSLVYPLPEPEVVQPVLINVDKGKAHLEVDLLDYIADPLELGLYFDYDSNQDSERLEGIAHGQKAEIDGSVLKIDYEFDEELLYWSEENNIIVIRVMATNYSGMSKMVDVKIVYKASTDNEEIQLSSLHVYPNPVESILNLVSPEKISAVYIYSLNGYMVYHVKNPGSVLDLSHLTSGAYLMQVETPQKERVVKIIKK